MIELRKRHIAATAGTGISIVAATQVVTNTDLGSTARDLCVLLAPASSTRNIIQPTAATYVPLTIRGFASQSGNLLEFIDSNNALIHNIPIDTTKSVVFNETGLDLDFRVEGDGDTKCLWVDASRDVVYIGDGLGGESGAGALAKLNITTSRRTAFAIAQTSTVTTSPTYGLSVNVTSKPASSMVGEVAGILFIASYNPQANSVTQDLGISGGIFGVSLTTDAARTGITVASMYVIQTSLGNESVSGSSVTITDGVCFDSLGIVGTGVGTMNVTNFYGLRIQNPTAGTITYNNGIYLASQTRGTNNTNILIGTGTTGNWSIYNNSAYDSLISAVATKTYWRDTATYINSSSANILDIVAPTLQVTGATKLGAPATNYVNIATTGILSFVGTARIAWTKKTANGVTATGYTVVGQTVSMLQTANDGNTYVATEVVSTPNYLVVDFTGVTAFNWVRILADYDGTASHSVAIQLEITPFDGSTWHTFGTLIDTGVSQHTMCEHSFFVPSDTAYINAGVVKVRFIHSDTETNNHTLTIDECSLYQ